VSAGSAPDEVHEPGRAWVPLHHHDPDVAKAHSGRPDQRHWKTKMWKRRSTVRRAKARAFQMVAE